MDNESKSIIAIVIIGLMIIFFFAGQEIKEDNKHMNECMQYHKEYECVAILKNNNQSYPIIIPMNIGR